MTTNLISLADALIDIKLSIETAIKTGGTVAKNNLIRTQKPIKLLHDVVKSELIRNSVNPQLIKPALKLSKGELALSGFFKRKNQDVCVVQKDLIPTKEILKTEGFLYGEKDEFGSQFTQKTLSINVRSQLSSSAKNFDTLYERTFAEALNLHLRCPEMVLGEFYMIAVREYDSNQANNNTVAFRKPKGIEKHIEKYLRSFSAINGRKSKDNEHYKYERICLLIVDFSTEIPKYYSTDEQLKADGLLPENTKASIQNLNFETFISDLLNIYSARFGKDKLI